jgi:hypothetical protein
MGIFGMDFHYLFHNGILDGHFRVSSAVWDMGRTGMLGDGLMDGWFELIMHDHVCVGYF